VFAETGAVIANKSGLIDEMAKQRCDGCRFWWARRSIVKRSLKLTANPLKSTSLAAILPKPNFVTQMGAVSSN
jgi:hypothetical protein